MKFSKLLVTAVSAISILMVNPVSAFDLGWGCGCDDLDLYGGIELGLGTFTGTRHINNDLADFHRTIHHGDNSFIGGGFIGVKKDVWDCLWASLEADIFYDSLDSKLFSDHVTTVTDVNYSLSRKFGYGLGLRVGMDICNAYPYWMVGFEGGRWEQTIHNNATTPFFGIPGSSSLKSHKDTISPKVGLGAEFNWDCNIGLRIEYTYVFGPKLRSDRDFDAGGGVIQHASHSLRVNEGKALLALIYHW